MLCIRLQRLGKKKQPVYRFIVSDKHKDTQAKSIEILGTYNAISQPKQLELKKDRIEYWLSVGAQPSPTVHNILLKEGLVKGKKSKAVAISKKRAVKLDAKKGAEKAKAEAAVAAAAEAKAAAEEKAKADAEAAKAAAEAPAPEVVEAPAPEAAPEVAPEPVTETPAAEPAPEETPAA